MHDIVIESEAMHNKSKDSLGKTKGNAMRLYQVSHKGKERKKRKESTSV